MLIAYPNFFPIVVNAPMLIRPLMETKPTSKTTVNLLTMTKEDVTMTVVPKKRGRGRPGKAASERKEKENKENGE